MSKEETVTIDMIKVYGAILLVTVLGFIFISDLSESSSETSTIGNEEYLLKNKAFMNLQKAEDTGNPYYCHQISADPAVSTYRSRCYLITALRSGDENLCPQDNWTTQRECISAVKGNFSFCQTRTSKDFCYTDMAIQSRTPFYCLNGDEQARLVLQQEFELAVIEGYGESRQWKEFFQQKRQNVITADPTATPWSNYCFTEITWKTSKNWCDFIKNDEDSKNECLAGATRKYSYCGFIDDQTSREICYYMFADLTGEIEQCNLIKDESRKNTCYAMGAIYNNDNFLCYEIVGDEDYKNFCIDCVVNGLCLLSS